MKWMMGIAFAVILAAGAFAQAPGDVIWTKMLGGPDFDQAKDIIQTRDGGYAVVGEYMVIDSTFRTAIYVVRLDDAGDTLWTRIFDHGDYCDGRAIMELPDSGYIVTGTHRPVFVDTLPSDDNVYVMRLNSLGDTLWTRLYGDTGISNEYGYCFCAANDGGYIIVGEAFDYIEHPDSYYAFKIDSIGNTLWQNYFYLSWSNVATDVQPTRDGGYIIAGNTGGFGGYGIFLVKIDSQGDSLWTRYINDTGDEQVYSIAAAADGGFFLAGTAWDSTYESWNCLLAKTDSLGNQEWRRSYGGPANEEFRSMAVAADGGLMLAGYSDAFGDWVTDVWLVAADANGDTLWTRNYGGSNNDQANSVALCGSGDIVFAGYANYDWMTGDFYVAKVSGGASGGCVYVPGDINGNGVANGIDVGFGVNYFKGGSLPPVDCGGICPQSSPFYAAGDVNGNCVFNGIDVSYYVNYLKGVTPALVYCETCPPASR